MKGFEREPLLKTYKLDDGTLVEVRDASKRVVEDRPIFEHHPAGIMKRMVDSVRNDEDNFPDYPVGATRHWLYFKNGKTLSVLEVQDMGWKFEIYPFDDCVTLENDPYDSGIERYNTEEETFQAVLKLLEKM